MASPTSLLIRHIFGINSSVFGNGSFIDEHNIGYIAGQSFVSCHRRTKRQKYIEFSDAITCFTTGSSMKIAAIAERGEKPAAHIIDLKTFKKKKCLIAPESVCSREFICLQFNADDSLLLTLSGFPDWTLLCWDWNKAKIVASLTFNIAIHTCQFNPVDITMISVVSKEFVKFYRLNDKDLRELDTASYHKSGSFLSCCWLRVPDDTLLVGTEDGGIYIFQHGEFHSVLDSPPGIDSPVTSLVAVLGGFFVGSKSGEIIYYQYNEAHDRGLNGQFAPTIKLKHELCSGHVSHMFISPSEANLGILTSDGQCLCLHIDEPTKLSLDKLSYMISQHHAPKAITGLDLCARKPLILTSCKDNSIKLWNFQQHELAYHKSFIEEICCVALHPSGLHCAIGFADKLRLYRILVDDMRLCQEISIKSCRECKFNRSGNLLAAINGNGVIIVDFYSGDKIADLRGHNSKVRSIAWLDTGCYLASCGQDGAVYLWDVEGSKRIAEYIQKGTTYVSIAVTHDIVFVVGSDKMLRPLSLPDLNPMKAQEANILVTNISLSTAKNAIFASTGEYGRPGYVRCYNHPMNGEYDEYASLSSQITRMKLSYDENFLVVADDMGCMMIYELRSRQDRIHRNVTAATTGNHQHLHDMELLSSDLWSDEVLITKSELDDKVNIMSELKAKVEELKLHNEYQLKLKDMIYADKMKETNEKFIQELEQRRSGYEVLKEDKHELESEYAEKIKQAEEEHQYKMQEIESSYQAQIMELVDNYQQLVKERDAQTCRLQQQRDHLITSHESYIQELYHDYDHKIEEEQHVRRQLEEQLHDVNHEIQEIETQLDDDVDTEIDNFRNTYDERLTLTRETTLKLKGENGIMKKKRIVYHRENECYRDEIKALLDKDKEYHAQIDVLEKEIKSHKKEIKSRDHNITDKEKKIYELKKQNQELDKFKFVLDYKIRELKQQIEPRQVEIVKMKDKINEMDMELSKYHHSNNELDIFIGTLRDRILLLQDDIKKKRQVAMTCENLFSHFRNDLQNIMSYIQLPAQLKSEAMLMIHKHGSHTGTLKPRLDVEVEDEYHRHKEFLARSIAQLKKEMDASLNTRVEANASLRQDNLLLIDEINMQRDENRDVRNALQADIGKYRRYAQQYSDMNMTGTTQNVVSSNAEPRQSNKEQIIDPLQELRYNQKRIAALESIIDTLNQSHDSSNNSSLPAISSSPRPASSNDYFMMPFVTAKEYHAADDQHDVAVDHRDDMDVDAHSVDDKEDALVLPPIISASRV